MDLLFVLAFVGLPLAIWLASRSLAWTAIALGFAVGVAGNAVQSLISLGMHWNVRGLQWLMLGLMTVVLVLAIIRGRGTASMRRQVLAIVLPAVLIGMFLVLMRIMAPGSPGPLSVVGYLVNHPQAEDNAKWLHLASQLADGRDVVFNGYAGGPLLLVMAMMAALISVLSSLMLGGVNEVAVAANSVVGTQFLLIALVPFALAPLAERRPVLYGTRTRILVPGIWVAAVVLFVASSVVTSFGHLSLQFVLLALVLWSCAFLVRAPGRARLLTTLAIATTASVWIPLNILGLVLLVVCLVWVLRAQDWWGLGVVFLTGVTAWDALVSSTLFLFGIDLGPGASDTAAVVTGDSSAPAGATASVQTALTEQVETAKSLFTAPGGVEQIQPLVGGLALASVLFTVWLLARTDAGRWKRCAPFAPIAVMGLYLVLIDLGDAVTTGGAPHYGGHKLAFAFTIMSLASTLPIAIAGLDRRVEGMTPTRWFAVGGVVLVLTLDTMLPRALSALSPQLWPAIDSSAPAYWSAAEVKPKADQPIASLPVACVFAPPESAIPTALPLGQQAYNCTRMLLGMNGLEGNATVLVNWLQTDWMSNQPHWENFYTSLQERAGDLRNRTVVLMNADGGTAGLTTLGSLLQQYPPNTP